MGYEIRQRAVASRLKRGGEHTVYFSFLVFHSVCLPLRQHLGKNGSCLEKVELAKGLWVRVRVFEGPMLRRIECRLKGGVQRTVYSILTLTLICETTDTNVQQSRFGGNDHVSSGVHHLGSRLKQEEQTAGHGNRVQSRLCLKRKKKTRK